MFGFERVLASSRIAVKSHRLLQKSAGSVEMDLVCRYRFAPTIDLGSIFFGNFIKNRGFPYLPP